MVERKGTARRNLRWSTPSDRSLNLAETLFTRFRKIQGNKAVPLLGHADHVGVSNPTTQPRDDECSTKGSARVVNSGVCGTNSTCWIRRSKSCCATTAPTRSTSCARGSAISPFGRGIHYCLGESLVLLEARIAFRRLLDRFPSIRLTAESRYRDGIVPCGVESRRACGSRSSKRSRPAKADADRPRTQPMTEERSSALLHCCSCLATARPNPYPEGIRSVCG